jgi:hypothetical protein
MQGDALGREARFGVREDAVIEDHKGMADLAAGLADRPHEIELRRALAGEILDQQHPRVVLQLALDLGVAAKAFGLLAHIKHRQRQPVGDPRRERNPGGLPAGDRVQRFVADPALDQIGPHIHQLAPRARERDQPPAIDIDRRQPSRGEGERVVGPEQHSLGFQQDAGGDFRRIDFARRTIGVRGLGHDLS